MDTTNMDTKIPDTRIPSSRDVRQTLGPYIAAQAVLVMVIQVITALRGPTIDLIDGLLLVPSALLWCGYEYRYQTRLNQIRFGSVVAHAATFAIVNGSYHLAALIRVAMERSSDTPSAQIPLDGSWFGPLIAMCGLWAIGLVAHIGSAVAQRGYES